MNNPHEIAARLQYFDEQRRYQAEDERARQEMEFENYLSTAPKPPVECIEHYTAEIQVRAQPLLYDASYTKEQQTFQLQNHLEDIQRELMASAYPERRAWGKYPVKTRLVYDSEDRRRCTVRMKMYIGSTLLGELTS